MSIFKCKMCGGTIEFEQGATVGTCDSCGTKQTLPKFGLDDEKKANLYDRANHFRRNNDFDKAMGIYESILNEDKTDAEAYWSLVLCKYGIEYVEDPATHKRVPTVNRTQFASVLADEDYKSALEYATIEQKIIYEKEAKAIDEIQKGILEISNKEEPFDVFICYKESDNNGRRTHDSVLANDLYHQLTQESFKVFFSRITLEDKLGTAYEPYIFAALNSAKVMVVIGTKPEYFNAVWVKNEWSRYLALIKKGAKKVLIPAYKDMDPYDLPEEFSHLQAQDMSKLGFMQDLIRGIKKLTATEQPKTVVKETVVVNNNSVSSDTAPMIKRIFLFLEDGDWKSADEYCEKVLDKDPENGEAYLGKLMADLEVETQEELKNCADPFEDNKYCAKACRYSAEIAKRLKADNQYIRERNEEARKQRIYNDAVDKMQKAQTESDFKETAKIFDQIKGFKDSDKLVEKCLENAKEKIYRDAFDTMNYGDYEEAIDLFATIKGYKDSDELAAECLEDIYISAKNTIELAREESDFKEALDLFAKIENYKNSEQMKKSCLAILDAYKNSNNVKNALKRYKNEYVEEKKEVIITQQAGFIKKLFGGKDTQTTKYEYVKKEVPKFIKLDSPVNAIIMTEGLCNEMTLAEAFAYMTMLNDSKFAGFSDWTIPPEEDDVEALKKSGKVKNYETQKTFWNKSSISQNHNSNERKYVCCVRSKGFVKIRSDYIDKGDYIELIHPIGNIRMIHDEEHNICWNEAMDYAKNLRSGGYNDWRLPTKDELKIIYKIRRKRLEFDGFGYGIDFMYWSSSTSLYTDSNAWCMQSGVVHFEDESCDLSAIFVR